MYSLPLLLSLGPAERQRKADEVTDGGGGGGRIRLHFSFPPPDSYLTGLNGKFGPGGCRCREHNLITPEINWEFRGAVLQERRRKRAGDELRAEPGGCLILTGGPAGPGGPASPCRETRTSPIYTKTFHFYHLIQVG